MTHLHDRWDEKMGAVIDGLDTIAECRQIATELKREAAAAILQNLANAGFVISLARDSA